MNDEELLVAYYGCDANAYALLWFGQKKPKRIGYFTRLNGYLQRQFPAIREDDCFDIVNQVGLKIAESKHGERFDTKRPFRPWAFKLVKNQALDFLKKKGNQELTGQESAEGQHFDTTDRRGAVAHGFEDDHVDAAYAAIDRLEPHLREVLILRLNGIANQDVAAILGIAEGTVSNRLKEALQHVSRTMNSPNHDDNESLDPTSERFFRRLQDRHEHELTLALERMKQHGFQLDANGRIVGFTNMFQSSDLDYIQDHLRGVLPVYLLRQGIDTSHANAVFEFVIERLQAHDKTQRFRVVLANLLQAYCEQHKLTPNPTSSEAEFLHRLLLKETLGTPSAQEVKEWLPQGTIRTIDDLVDPLQWPESLSKQRSFTARMRQLHGALYAVLKTEGELLDGASE